MYYPDPARQYGTYKAATKGLFESDFDAAPMNVIPLKMDTNNPHSKGPNEQ